MLFEGGDGFIDVAHKLFHSRSLVTEDKQKDRETLALLRKEYELYKDQWGLNLKYSQEAGESRNYSKMLTYMAHAFYLCSKFISCQDSLGASSGAYLLWQLNL